MIGENEKARDERIISWLSILKYYDKKKMIIYQFSFCYHKLFENPPFSLSFFLFF